jgi:hypothetical protein
MGCAYSLERRSPKQQLVIYFPEKRRSKVDLILEYRTREGSSAALDQSPTRRFLKRQHCEELSECRDLIHRYETSPTKELATEIWEHYIKRGAEREINISFELKKKTEIALGVEGAMDSNLFMLVKKEIAKLALDNILLASRASRESSSLSQHPVSL